MSRLEYCESVLITSLYLVSFPSITALSCHIASPSSASQVRPVGLPSGEAFPVLVADQVRLPRDRCGEDGVTEAGAELLAQGMKGLKQM